MAASRENSRKSIATQLGNTIALDFGNGGVHSFNTELVIDYMYSNEKPNEKPDEKRRIQRINRIMNMLTSKEQKALLLEIFTTINQPYTETPLNVDERFQVYWSLFQLKKKRDSNAKRVTALPYTSSVRMPGSTTLSYSYEEMESRNEVEFLRKFIKETPISADNDAAIIASAPEIQSTLIKVLEGYVQSVEPHPTISELCVNNPAHQMLRKISTYYRLAYDFAHDWRIVAFLVLDKIFSSGDDWKRDLKDDVPLNTMLHKLVEEKFSDNKIKSKLHKYISNCHASLQGTRAGESTSEERCRTAMLALNRERIILSNDPSVVGKDVTPWLYDNFKDTLLMTIRADTPNKDFKKFLDENIWGVYNESCNLGRDDLIRILNLPEGKSTIDTKNTLTLLKGLKTRTPIRFWEDQYDAANVASLSGTVMIDRSDFRHKPTDILGSKIQAFPKGTEENTILAGFETIRKRPDMIRRIKVEGGLVSEYKGCIGIILGDPTELSVNRIAATLGDKCQRGGASAENLECLKMEWLDEYKEEDERAILCLSKTWTDEIQRIYLTEFYERIRTLEIEGKVRKGLHNGVLQITLDTLFQYALQADGSFPHMAFSGLDADRNPCLFLRCFDKTAIASQQQQNFNERQAALSVLINQHAFLLETANALLRERQELCDDISKHTAYPDLCLASAMLSSNVPSYKQKAEIETEKYKNLGELLKAEFLKRDKTHQATLHGAILDSPKTIQEAIERVTCVKDMLEDFDDGLTRIRATFRNLNAIGRDSDLDVNIDLFRIHKDIVSHVRDAGLYKEESKIQICAIAAMAMFYKGEGDVKVNFVIRRLIEMQDTLLKMKSLQTYESEAPQSKYPKARFGYTLLQGYFIITSHIESQYPRRILECIAALKNVTQPKLPIELQFNDVEYKNTFIYLCSKDPQFTRMMKISASLLFILINMDDRDRGGALLAYSKILKSQTANNTKSKKKRNENAMNEEKIEQFTSWHQQLNPEPGRTYTPSTVVSFNDFVDECMSLEDLLNAWTNGATASTHVSNHANVQPMNNSSNTSSSSSSSSASSASSAFTSIVEESQLESQRSPQKSRIRVFARRGNAPKGASATSSQGTNAIVAQRSTKRSLGINFPNKNSNQKNNKKGGTRKRARKTHKRHQRKRQTRNRKARKTRKN